MSTIADFNRIEDCDKTPAECIDAYAEMYINEDEPLSLKLDTSWGNSEVDLGPAIKAGETLTTLYLSPENNPNCLVYEPERGDNICITGDALSRIISMTKLKDVDQSSSPSVGDVYIYGQNNLFQPFSLQTFITDTNNTLAMMRTAITNLQNAVHALQTTVANHETRIAAIEAILTKPTGTPNGAGVVWGNINLYSDPNAVIDNNGNVTTLDKTHGLYTHNLNNTAYGDEIMG